MIVRCPECSTGFNLPDDQIADEGTKLRCSKCRHIFRIRSDGDDAVEIFYTDNDRAKNKELDAADDDDDQTDADSVDSSHQGVALGGAAPSEVVDDSSAAADGNKTQLGMPSPSSSKTAKARGSSKSAAADYNPFPHANVDLNPGNASPSEPSADDSDESGGESSPAAADNTETPPKDAPGDVKSGQEATKIIEVDSADKPSDDAAGDSADEPSDDDPSDDAADDPFGDAFDDDDNAQSGGDDPFGGAFGDADAGPPAALDHASDPGAPPRAATPAPSDAQAAADPMPAAAESPADSSPSTTDSPGDGPVQEANAQAAHAQAAAAGAAAGASPFDPQSSPTYRPEDMVDPSFGEDGPAFDPDQGVVDNQRGTPADARADKDAQPAKQPADASQPTAQPAAARAASPTQHDQPQHDQTQHDRARNNQGQTNDATWDVGDVDTPIAPHTVGGSGAQKAANFLLIVLIVGAGFLGVVAGLSGGFIDFKRFPHMLEVAFGGADFQPRAQWQSDSGPKTVPAPKDPVQFGAVFATPVDMTDDTSVLLVRGVANNAASTGYSDVVVRAILLDASERPITETEAPLGGRIMPSTIAEAESVAQAKELLPTSAKPLASHGSAPFSLIFDDVPPKVFDNPDVSYRIEIADKTADSAPAAAAGSPAAGSPAAGSPAAGSPAAGSP